jgi:hypothetical protein
VPIIRPILLRIVSDSVLWEVQRVRVQGQVAHQRRCAEDAQMASHSASKVLVEM